MTTVTERLGFVYIIMRPDLKACYVGQSIFRGRPLVHLRPGSYQHAALCVNGVQPVIERPETNIPRGAELDEAERDWMRAMIEEGWTLVNALGPDNVFPKMPFELASKGGKKGGVIGGSKVQARRRTDPEFDAYWREVAAKAGMRGLRARRLADPEFDARVRTAELDALRRGVETSRVKRAIDPVWVAQQKENARLGGLAGGKAGGIATSRIQRMCAECGHGPTTPGGLGWHHKSRGHVGFIDVTPGSPVTDQDGE